MTHALMIINPVARLLMMDAKTIRFWAEEHFKSEGWTLDVYETTGEEDLRQILHQKLASGPRPEFVIAAGGDGTLSAVADALIDVGIPMAVLPVGTANLLARELQIPLDIGRALALLTGENRVRNIDVMQANQRYHILNLSIGMSSQLIKMTERRHKRTFGVLAYIWNGFIQLFGLRQHRYKVIVDRHPFAFRASEVMVTNGGIVGVEPLRWDPGISVDDGIINICILRTRTLVDFASLFISALLRRHQQHPMFACLWARNEIILETKKPSLVQADGEIIGKTPVHIKVIPNALPILVPVKPEAIGVTLGDFRVIRHIPISLARRIALTDKPLEDTQSNAKN